MTIPYVHVSFCRDNPIKQRWDQQWLGRVLAEQEYRICGWGWELEERNPGPGEGAVLIFACGHYAEHRETSYALKKLQRLVEKLPWSLVIATSDECSWFPWVKFRPPKGCRVWVMTPRPGNKYPEDTFFIGEGCPVLPLDIRRDKTFDVFFMGQVNHERREAMMEAVKALPEELDVWTVVTPSFGEGYERQAYLEVMSMARVCPAPSGPRTQDSFRFFEALECQSIPVADFYRPKTDSTGDYWAMLFGPEFDYCLRDWDDLGNVVALATTRPEMQPKVSAWWQQYKRSVAFRLQADIGRCLSETGNTMPYRRELIDRVSVIMVTSPSPLHPSTDMIEETLESVRSRIPGVEVLIGIDGLRPEQEDRRVDYYEYMRRLCAVTNQMLNVTPVMFDEHRHQSGMVRALLEQISTDYVLFMEHDAPLIDVIDFPDVVQMMDDNDLGLLRFTHEHGVIPEHEYLFLETKPEGRMPFVRTVQYSARPHLIRTDRLRTLMTTYFGSESRTFLEDTLHGAVQWLPNDPGIGPSTARKRLEMQWERHRMAVYAPRGSWKRSAHLDGRRGDTKWRTWIAYDGDTPDWAPAPGWMDV